MQYDVKDLTLAAAGKKRIEWAERHMPVLREIRKRLRRKNRLKGSVLAPACM